MILRTWQEPARWLSRWKYEKTHNKCRKKKKNDVMGQEGGTVIPCCHTDRGPRAGESRDRVLMTCQPGKAPGPVSDSVRPKASEEDIWCWAQRNEVGWRWGFWVPRKYNLKSLARGSTGLSSLGTVQDRCRALAYHAGNPRSDVRHHTHRHTKHTCTWFFYSSLTIDYTLYKSNLSE